MAHDWWDDPFGESEPPERWFKVVLPKYGLVEILPDTSGDDSSVAFSYNGGDQQLTVTEDNLADYGSYLRGYLENGARDVNRQRTAKYYAGKLNQFGKRNFKVSGTLTDGTRVTNSRVITKPSNVMRAYMDNHMNFTNVWETE